MQSSRITEAHSGLWYKKEYDGQGFDIIVKGERVVVYNYTFSQDGEKQRFYMGNGIIEDGACVFDWYTTKNGTFDDPTTREVIKVGKAQLFFNDDDTGVFHFNTTEHGRGSVNLTRLSTMIPSEYNGSWYAEERVGEGFSIQRFDNLIVAYWYTYDNKGNQKWYTLSGKHPSELIMYETLGGRWMFYDDIETKVIGEARMFFNRGGGLTIKYDSPSLGVGERQVVRLF